MYDYSWNLRPYKDTEQCLEMFLPTKVEENMRAVMLC